MSRSRPTHRIPRGFIDPIESRADALAVLALAAAFGHDTIAILLDPDRCGVGILVVTDTRDDDAIFRIIDVCIDAQYTEISGLILATSRPGGWVEIRLDPAEVDRRCIDRQRVLGRQKGC